MFQTLKSYYQTAASDLRYQGPEVLLYRLITKLLSPMVRLDLQILYDIDLSHFDNVLPAKVPVTIERASLADLEEIIEMQAPRLSSEQMAGLSDEDERQYALSMQGRAKGMDTYRRQMLADEYFFVARVGGAIGHSNWLHFHDSGQTNNCHLELRPGEVYSTDGFTAVSQRGKRLLEAVATYMLMFARQRGCHLGYTITDMTKAVSRRSLRRIGWRWRGTILYVAVRGLKRTWLLSLGGDVSPLMTYARNVHVVGSH